MERLYPTSPTARRKSCPRGAFLGLCEEGLVKGILPGRYSRLKPFVVEQCPFANLPELKSGRWGQGLIAAKMKECIWVKPTLVANFEFLEWTDTNHVRHIKFVGLRTDKNPRQVVRE
jgi:ATP dependent DNA ligase C terminal region